VKNLLRHCPGFWRSDELRQAVVAGPLLSLDTAFFVRELRAALNGTAEQDGTRRSPLAGIRRRDDSPGPRRGSARQRGSRSPPPRHRSPSSERDSRRSGSVEELEAPSQWRNAAPEQLGGSGAGWSAADADKLRRTLSAFLAEQPWALLCRRLLHTLPDADLLDFARHLVRPQRDGSGSAALGLVFGESRWRRAEDLLLASALADHGRQLWRLLAEDAEDHEVRKPHIGRRCGWFLTSPFQLSGWQQFTCEAVKCRSCTL